MSGQEKFRIQLIDTDQRLPGEILRQERFNRPLQRFKWLEQMQLELFERGYLSFSVDSIIESDKTWYAFIQTGERYDWAQLSRGNLDGATLGSIRFRDKIYFQRAFNPNQVALLFESVLSFCENNGYPFATIRLDSVRIADQSIKASLHLEKNQLVKIDSVVVRGNAKTHPAYFQNYLDLKPGMLYNESHIARADDWLEELAFINPIRPTEVVFTEDLTKVQLYANDKKASRFDGVLGIQPNEVTGQIGITGDIKLDLQNAFKRGETISLNWRRLQTATQDIRIRFAYPYLFNTPLGADLRFSLYRRDTTFVQIQAKLGVSYLFAGRDYIQVYFEPRQSNVISESFVPTDGLANSGANLFGLEVLLSHLDYRLNPTRGYQVNLNGAAGTRNIRKNPELNQEIYDNIPDRSTQWNGAVDAQLFTPLTPRNTVMFRLNGAIIQSGNNFVNEVHRIGGMQTIRGFDEESIFASAFSILTVEYRFLLEKNSNIFAFFDGAWYETDTEEAYLRDTPFGFGLGIRFETGAGIFSLTYALGRQMDNPILIRAGKIHFGFAGFF